MCYQEIFSVTFILFGMHRWDNYLTSHLLRGILGGMFAQFQGMFAGNFFSSERLFHQCEAWDLLWS